MKLISKVMASMVAGSVVLAPTAVAVDSHVAMAGTWGVKPKYATIKYPDGVRSPSLLRYSTSPGQRGINSAVSVVGAWLDAQGVSDGEELPSLTTYSMSTHAVVGMMRNGDERLKGVELWLLGAPESPGNGWMGIGYQRQEGLPTEGDWSNATLVVIQYDAVADKPANSNFYAWLNSISSGAMTIHRKGYNNLDLEAWDEEYIDPATGVRTIYYHTDVLPMLAWRDWFTSDAKMAELDAKYRPLVEAGHNRPVGEIDKRPEVEASPIVPSEVADEPAQDTSGESGGALAGKNDLAVEVVASPATSNRERGDDDLNVEGVEPEPTPETETESQEDPGSEQESPTDDHSSNDSEES